MLVSSLANRVVVPEGVGQDERAHLVGHLLVDALGRQQQVEQVEKGEDRMEADPFGGQHLHSALLSVHHHHGVRDL